LDAQTYLKRARTAEPPAPYFRNALLAFVGGGAVCAIAQAVLNFFIGYGFKAPDATGPTAVVMVFFASVATALGFFDNLAEWFGMGASLPITGFANAIVAPAMEFRTEGLVLGTGSRMFQVAGPVIAFGLATAFVSGLVFLVGQRLGV